MKKSLLLLLSCVALLTMAATMNHIRFSQIYESEPSGKSVDLQVETPTVNLVLGGLRGVVADWLWVRMMQLQEQGQYLEIMQLADWITKLQPQFPEIWTFQAWNLAYNISVFLPDGQERWRWIYQGYKILRDDGIPATRYHPDVCTELAWILMHKIAGDSDDFADTYFHEWLKIYTPLLDDQGTLPQPSAQYERFMKEAGIPKRIIEEFESKFGQHDWRHPLTHAAAWAYTGMSMQQNQTRKTMAQRLFQQSYYGLFIQGNIENRKPSTAIVLTPDFKRLRGLLSTYTPETTVQSAPPEHTKQALERIIQILAGQQQIQEAEKVYQVLQTLYPEQYPSKRQRESLLASPQHMRHRIIPANQPK